MKSQRGGKRKGSGRPKSPDTERKIQWWIYLKQSELAAFEAIGGTRKQVADWIRCYPMARSETDRLLAQASIASRLLNFLEGLGTPESEALTEELFGLIVNRNSDEVRVLEGEKAGDSWIV